MAKIKDLAGGFFNNDTIYSPNGFTQARKISNAIVDRNISDMQNEIKQGENFGAEARKNKNKNKKDDGTDAVSDSTGDKKTVTGAPLPSKKDLVAQKKEQKAASKADLEKSRDFAFKKAEALEKEADDIEKEAKGTEDEDEKKELLKQAKALRAEAERTRKDADTTYNANTKKETLVSPDSVTSADSMNIGPTTRDSKQRTEVQDTVNQHHETGKTEDKENVSSELKGVTPGTKTDPGAAHGRKADEPVPKPDLPQARAGLRDDQAKAEQTLKDLRSERDDFIESARQDKKQTKRDMRERSIMPDDFDFDDEFDSTDPFIASLFQKGKINRLLKDQIKEQYPEQIAEITERIKNDPDNADLSGKEMRKLINAAVKKFIEPIWKSAGGDTQVNKIGLVTPVAAIIKKMMDGSAHESVTKVMNDKRAALEKKQNRSLKDQMFLDAFDFLEKEQGTAEMTAELKGEVKNARDKLTAVNAEVREHERAVDRARNEFNKGGRKAWTEYKNGWAITHASGDGGATQYASRIEDRDGKKMFVTYSITDGSPNTSRDPVRPPAEYQEYKGERDPNIMDVENFARNNLNQVEGGFKGKNAAIKTAQNEKDFEALDGQNYFAYRDEHRVMAPKIMKLISDLGGKIDAETGKIYTTSVDQFPKGARELHLEYKEAKHVAGKSDEDMARLTGMTPEEVKARQIIGMTRKYKLGDVHVIKDSQGRTIYQMPKENKTSLSAAQGRTFYINWNEPHNRKVVADYAKRGLDKNDIPLSELKTVNTSRSSEGNVDWTDKEKTKAAEKAQKAQYTGAYKPSADILDALIGFGNKSKPL